MSVIATSHTELIQVLPLEIAAVINVNIPRTLRTIYTSASLDIALDHYRSIGILLKEQQHGSASALLRCEFESYVFGLWVYTAAHDSELETMAKNEQLTSRTKKSRGKPSFKSFREFVMEAGEPVPGIRKSIEKDLNGVWKTLNSYTHGGSLALLRRLTDSGIDSNYSMGDIEDISCFANRYALFCLQLVSVVAKDSQINQKVDAIAASIIAIDEKAERIKPSS